MSKNPTLKFTREQRVLEDLVRAAAHNAHEDLVHALLYGTPRRPAQTFTDPGKPGGDHTCEIDMKRGPDGAFHIVDVRHRAVKSSGR